MVLFPRGMGREMTPTMMPAKAGHFSLVILWCSLTLVCVEPSVSRHLLLATLARSRVAFSVHHYLSPPPPICLTVRLFVIGLLQCSLYLKFHSCTKRRKFWQEAILIKHMSQLHGHRRPLGDIHQQLVSFHLTAGHCKADGVPHVPPGISGDKRDTSCRQEHAGAAFTCVWGNHCFLSDEGSEFFGGG